MNRREAIASLMALPAGATMTRTEIRPYDLIVITVPGEIDEATAARAKAQFDEMFKDVPNVRALVLGDGISLAVVREGVKPR